MSWLTLTLVAFVCFILVFLIKQKQYNHPALQFPYQLKEPLFQPAERELLEMLQQTAGDQYLILPKVRIADVVEVTAIPRRAYWYHATSRIAAEHFDFLLCSKQDLVAVCAIELREADNTDTFNEELCRTIGLPWVEFTAQTACSFSEVRASLDRALA